MSGGISPSHLLAVVADALSAIGAPCDSLSARALLVGTAAQESGLGRHLRQQGSGPALGVYQMEPATHDDIWANYLAYNKDLAAKVRKFAINGQPSASQLVGNLYYATAMARVHYLRNPEALPAFNDIPGLARYYKRHYNTPRGAATEAQFIANWNALIGPHDIRKIEGA